MDKALDDWLRGLAICVMAQERSAP